MSPAPPPSYPPPAPTACVSCLYVMLVQLVIRYRLHTGQPRELGGLKLHGAAIDFAVTLTDLHYFVRYVSTCYGSLCQHNTVRVDVESIFQVVPSVATMAAGGSTSWAPRSQAHLLVRGGVYYYCCC